MNLHFYLERKKLKSPERAIYCYIRGLAKGKTIQLNTKQRIRPEYWDNKLEQAFEKGKSKSSTAKELNNFLSSYKEEIKKTIYQILSMNPTADFEELRAAILEKFGKSQTLHLTLFQALDTFKEVRKKDMSPDSLRKYSTVIKHLKGYEKFTKSELTFSRLDMMFYDKFLSYLLKDDEKEEKEKGKKEVGKNEEKKKGMVNNSAYKIIGLLKIFLNWAHERNINPYLHFKKWKIKEDKVDIITLTEQELTTLYNMEFAEDRKHLQRARDLFLFGCYTGGRFGDLSKIEHQDVRGSKWYLRTGKTRDVLEIPLNDLALTIIARYSETSYPLPRLSNQKLNKYIKDVCEEAKIDDIIKTVKYRGNTPDITEKPKWKEVTTHTARRTFITQSLLRGMKAEIVMSISGHHNYCLLYTSPSPRD